MKRFGKKILLLAGITAMIGSYSTSFATEEEKIPTDIMPPTGTIQIVSDTSQGVDNVDIKINATDKIYVKDANGNMIAQSVTNNMMYAVSNHPFDTENKNEAEWHTYVPNTTINVVFDAGALQGRVYAMLKDNSGNTTSIFTGTSTNYEVIFNANAYGVTGMPVSSRDEEMDGTYGKPYAVPNTYPRKSGAFFLGWSTDPYATEGSYLPGDIVPAAAFSVGETELNLYAIWTRDEDGLPKLGEVCEIGDYVRYPVYYENAVYHNTTGNTDDCSYEGWRVIDIDTTTKEVTLLSAGVPLGFTGKKAKDDLPYLTQQANFLKLGTSTRILAKNGLVTETLPDAFKNSYTKKNGSVPDIHALNADDVKTATQGFADKNGDSSIAITSVTTRTSLSSGAYDSLFNIGANYWLADRASGQDLYYVKDDGTVGQAKTETKGIRIVVILNGNIYTDGKDIEGYWNLM